MTKGRIAKMRGRAVLARPPVRPRWRRLATDASGIALVEFALLAPILALLLANVVDFSRLVWAQMQSDYAAQIGVQAAYKTCANGTLPAKSNCTNLTSSITTAVHSTSLGSAVSVATGYPSEGYYCACGSDNTNSCSVGALVNVANYSSPPSPFNCSGYTSSGSSVAPGDYVLVNVAYSYSPLFSGLSLASSKTLTGSSLIRLQ
jgi:Flp pilus assembly protein TadG